MMKCSCEKWLTIAALTGWLGSMGGMVVLAVNTPAEHRLGQVHLKSPVQMTRIKHEVKAIDAKAKSQSSVKVPKTQANLALEEP